MAADPAEVLRKSRTIAVVGFSRDPAKSAHSVPTQLLTSGFTVIPVNPHADEIRGEKAFPTLAHIPADVEIDLVNVFRPSAEAGEVARRAIARGTKAIWLQQGIVSDEARQLASDAGIDFIEDTCIAVVRSINRITVE